MHHGIVSPEIAAGLLALKQRIADAMIPPSALDESINVAVWNIREFGKKARQPAALHYIAEIYHGDPIGGDAGGAFQTGLRYCINEKIQLDVTGGSGLWGDNKPSTFFGIGLRWEFGPIF